MEALGLVEDIVTSCTEDYRWCNHHHKLEGEHTVVDFGDGSFVANNDGIPLLKALNEIGLRTRTHHIEKGGICFVSILLDDRVRFEIKKVFEKDADRTKYNGMTELLILWDAPEEENVSKERILNGT